MVVITGLSGSGKPSIAFDIIDNESRRQYMESLDMITDGVSKAECESVKYVPPSISIQQHLNNKEAKTLFLYGSNSEEMKSLFPNIAAPKALKEGKFEGIITNIKRRYSEKVKLKVLIGDGVIMTLKGFENIRDELEYSGIRVSIGSSEVLSTLWDRYQQKNSYASDLDWENTVSSVKELYLKAFSNLR